MARIGVYYRVSTKKQEWDSQVEFTRRWFQRAGLSYDNARVFTDKISGAVRSREGLDALKEAILRRELDRVYFYKLDRLSRAGTEDVVEFLSFAARQDVEVIFTKDDFLNIQDRMVRMVAISLMAEMARKERETMQERIKDGLAARKAKGLKLGRQVSKKGETIRGALAAYDRGEAKPYERFGISKSHFYKLVNTRDSVVALDGGLPEQTVADRYWRGDVIKMKKAVKLYGEIIKHGRGRVKA